MRPMRSYYPTGKGLEEAVVGEISSVLLQVITCIGIPSEETVESWHCELMSEITLAGSLERRGQSQYEVSYKPTIKGRHQLHIRGSPFPVAVRLPIEKLSTPVLTIGGV